MHEVLIEVTQAGKRSVRSGDLAARMREQNLPMESWTIIGELNRLADLGLATLDEDTATWSLVLGKDFGELLETLNSKE